MATEEEVRSDASSPVTNRPVSTIVANATGRTDGRSMTYAPTASTVSTSSPASAATQVSRRAYQGRLPGTARGTGAGAGAAKTGEAATGAGETGSDTGAAGGCAYSFGVSAADDGGGAISASAPSATGSSGCSSTVGAMPSSACNSRATSGSRDEPPTRNSPASWFGRRPHRRMTAAVSYTARSTPGIATGATVVRDSISLAPRTSSQNSRRLRRNVVVSGCANARQASGIDAASTPPRCSTSAASTSRPPKS